MKIVTIIGARPQFIKAAPVSRALRSDPEVEEVLIHTGQHYDANLSDVFFEELQIPQPDHHLGVGSAGHGAQTGRMLEGIERLLDQHAPQWVLVYGDTNSTLAGALAAAKIHIPVAHVEAGLRSFNRRMPEELNRVMTDHASDRLFTPTEAAVENLVREGISRERIEPVGDVMYDAALYYGDVARERSRILDRVGLEEKGYILATIHRAENTDDARRLVAIFSALRSLAESVPIVLPLHPRTAKALDRVGWDPTDVPGLDVIDPIGYLDMARLEIGARLVVTDSGGVQKESYFHRVPCVTLRDETEWVELVDLGWNRLIAPTDETTIQHEVRSALEGTHDPTATEDLYGGGTAAEAIMRALARDGGPPRR